MTKTSLAVLMLFSALLINAQEYFPKNDGVKTTSSAPTAFINATIHVSHNQSIKSGTLLIKDGKVVASGTNVTVPKDAKIIDVKGKHIYPSFIDLYSSFGIDKPKRQPRNRGDKPQYDASRTGYYWNDHIMPEQHAMEQFKFDAKSANELLKAGFGVVNTHIHDGIHRGTGVLVALNINDGNDQRIINAKSAQHLSFTKSALSKQAYPTSIMGSIALLRQFYYDADWYAKGMSKTKDLSIEAYNANKNLVSIFEAGSKTNALRADKIGDLFNIQYIILGGGDEYERIPEIKATNAAFIIPVNFREAYDVENPFLTDALQLSDMKAWSQEPNNPKILEENGINFALTTHKLKSPEKFKSMLLKAIEYGLSKEKALEALTSMPAKLLGQASKIGSLNAGTYANFLITSGEIFDKKTKLYENWVQGEQHVILDMNQKDISGDYEFSLNGDTYKMTILGDAPKLKSKVTTGNVTLGSQIKYTDDWVHLSMTTKDTTTQDFIRVAALVKENITLQGKAILPNGTETTFLAKKETAEINKSNSKTDKNKDVKVNYISKITYPNMAYGFETLPVQETLLFKNATVWTNEAEGILQNTDVLIKNGKIAKIGKNLSNSSAKIIDATGKHLTSGIIDEHSHIATSSVNESGHNSTAEVSIEDVIDDEDINIYRNLAGGVTSIQVLHGSANPIGGRSAIIKLKWGASADNYIYNNSPKFIKFALGENVKQSNWGDNSKSRFPQTRMGVEQVYIDYFTRAKSYDALKQSGKPYRKDIELETLAEILNKERFISCHSYVQSEINMLMKVAEQFNFTVNTFTHILEGYKVADKMAEHDAGGSTFSDWWAYKYEVNDAIPYNAAIMHNQGVTVAINSDDAEMSRRLNQETAKTVKYGGMSEEDAWKFITLNPAKLLHIDDRVGSIKIGKDADLVLWSDHPMSVYTKAEKTIIEGVTYFDIERDKAMRKAIAKEKRILINEMLKAKNKGEKTQAIKQKKKVHMHCDYVEYQIN
ncbi:amidohydrolase family protein [Jejuia pallidilutea]|uniref:Secreted enzyme n=1 Tax=Jejuia pallidilutea TaxID=504487 RepID=A0A090WGT8_9FLAO|nr:amidohydrolase family protein [Jejuia pallidilutea]GAL66727.1 secreted enzyme [Jejuia pallidilutea]GAL69991.1 secreted enzyme [Jejuia pallidilutea]GAL90988.1 secreted enzyme [Jejuia pallidilutea]